MTHSVGYIEAFSVLNDFLFTFTGKRRKWRDAQQSFLGGRLLIAENSQLLSARALDKLE